MVVTEFRLRQWKCFWDIRPSVIENVPIWIRSVMKPMEFISTVKPMFANQIESFLGLKEATP